MIPEIIDTYTNELKKFPEKIKTYSMLQLSLKVSEEMYRSLLAYGKSIGVAEAMSLSKVELVEPGFLPDYASPDYPPKKLIVILAVFSGLITGLGLALILDYFDDTIHDIEDVEELKDITLLGNIPRFKKKDMLSTLSKGESAPDSQMSEAYRSIRNNIRFIAEDKKLSSFVVVSGLAGEGKSTTICNLAMAFARSGARVILADLDLRRPTIHEKLNLTNFKGITNCILRKESFKDAIQRYCFNEHSFDVLTAGPVPSDPSMIIESRSLKQILDEMRDFYDILLIDTPPAHVVSDAIILGSMVSQLVWVMDLKKIDVRTVQSLKEKFKQANIDIIGIINNNIQHNNSMYYQNYYYKR
jgi:capsular exopolysaccharide synthesis family protein